MRNDTKAYLCTWVGIVAVAASGVISVTVLETQAAQLTDRVVLLEVEVEKHKACDAAADLDHNVLQFKDEAKRAGVVR